MRVKFQNEPQAMNKDLLKHTVELEVVRSIRYLSGVWQDFKVNQ